MAIGRCFSGLVLILGRAFFSTFIIPTVSEDGPTTGNCISGGLDKGLDEIKAQGWTVVDMKHDWKRAFTFVV